ncbi:MAG TPA: hypothetical protein VGQ12_03850 [Candidatus Angelobacter sp.]|jgi:hypothetical protein|nr:hypothetical protein [Candidatus Angelobacter sp.]
MTKNIKTVLLTLMVTAAFCAGTVSASQLFRPFQTTCQGFCTKKTGCPNILGCACVFNNPGATVGKCSFIAAKPAK